MQRLKRLRVFCGPNGSGKSTLFQSVKGYFSEIPFINSDEIEHIITKQKLIDLSGYGLKLNAKDLSNFLKRSEAKSLLNLAGNSIGIYSRNKENETLRENTMIKLKVVNNTGHEIPVTFREGKFIKLTLPYPDKNNDGIVDANINMSANIDENKL